MLFKSDRGRKSVWFSFPPPSELREENTFVWGFFTRNIHILTVKFSILVTHTPVGKKCPFKKKTGVPQMGNYTWVNGVRWRSPMNVM